MQTGPTALPTIEAALSGFRLVWERPRAVAVWAVVCFAFNLGEALLVAGLAWASADVPTPPGSSTSQPGSLIPPPPAAP